jgi:uncharacterized protein
MERVMEIEKFKRYVVLLSNKPDIQRDKSLIREHVDFLRRLEREGKIVLCGPFTDYAGGMYILNSKDKNEAVAIAESDPFVLEDTRSFEIREWVLSCEENNHLGMG